MHCQHVYRCCGSVNIGDRMLTRLLCAPCAESPNSLIERGHYEQARTVLRRTRGVPDVELEFEDIYQASQAVREPCNRARQ